MQCYRPIFHALMAGNGVVLKPSEHTPRTGAWLVEQCNAVLPKGLVGVLLGDGALGAAFVDSDIDALIFTGFWRQAVLFLPEQENDYCRVLLNLEVRMPPSFCQIATWIER